MKRGRWYRDPDPSGFRGARPRAAAGGLKSEVRTARSARSEWARRFLEVVEHFGFGLRLARGRGDARHGLVRTLDVETGKLIASVQGIVKATHDVVITVEPIAPAKIDAALASLVQPTFVAAKLLAGELPGEFENAFAAVGAVLLPEERSEWTVQCDCDEPEQPCRHAAATCCVFAAELERDPLLLLALRGMARKELITRLGAAGEAARGEAPAPLPPPPPPENHPVPASDPAAYWLGAELPPLPGGANAIPSQPGALLRRLGPFPFWRGSDSLTAALEPVYRSAAIVAAAIALGPLFADSEDEDDE